MLDVAGSTVAPLCSNDNDPSTHSDDDPNPINKFYSSLDTCGCMQLL